MQLKLLPQVPPQEFGVSHPPTGATVGVAVEVAVGVAVGVGVAGHTQSVSDEHKGFLHNPDCDPLGIKQYKFEPQSEFKVQVKSQLILGVEVGSAHQPSAGIGIWQGCGNASRQAGLGWQAAFSLISNLRFVIDQTKRGRAIKKAISKPIKPCFLGDIYY